MILFRFVVILFPTQDNSICITGDIIQARGDIFQVIGLSYSGQWVILFRSEVTKMNNTIGDIIQVNHP